MRLEYRYHWIHRLFSLLLLGGLLPACKGAGSGAPAGARNAGSSCSGVSTININVFTENPRTSSGSNALAFNASLTSGMTSATTLSGLSGNCLLQNDRFQVSSDDLYPSSIAKPTSSNQSYAPTQPEFQQVGSLYYATQLRNLLVSTLGANLGTSRVSINAHCNYADNAYFSPNARVLCFGYHTSGGRKVWAADDADVVVHEAGHAVNHALASTDIMNSSHESGALDEGIADYWALTINNNSKLSEWFLGSIGAGYVRDASINFTYPTALVSEPHEDGRLITQVLWDLRSSSNLGKSTTDALVKNALRLLPTPARFSDFYDAFYDASGPAFLALSPAQQALIVSKFTAKGIHRIDSATNLRLALAETQVYVIDDHSTDYQSGGNCNGQLDVGETALILVNLENPDGAMGDGVATLGALPAGIQVSAGGDTGEFFRLNAASSFVSSLPASRTNRNDAILSAAFSITALTAGAKSFSLSFRPMYADPTGGSPGASKTVNFSLTVGSIATSNSCTDTTLWP